MSVKGCIPWTTAYQLHVYTPTRSLRSSSDTRILSTPNVILKSYGQRSFAYHGPTTWNSLPLALRHQQESDCFKRALKLICFLWINVTVMFSMLLCYYVLLFVFFFGLCFVRFMGHVGACSTKLSWDVLPDALCLAYYDCPLCVCTVSVTYLVSILWTL